MNENFILISLGVDQRKNKVQLQMEGRAFDSLTCLQWRRPFSSILLLAEDCGLQTVNPFHGRTEFRLIVSYIDSDAVRLVGSRP